MNNIHLYLLSLSYLFFALHPADASAQEEYAPVNIEGATWVLYDNNVGFNGVTGGHQVLVIRGDTTIDGMTYGKMYKKAFFPGYIELNNDNSPYSVGDSTFYAAVRDDSLNRRLYGRVRLEANGPLSKDTLIHDFGAPPGGTITGVYWEGHEVVEEYWTETLYGRQRRVQKTEFNRYVEGIGSLKYGPMTLSPLVFLNIGSTNLLDYCIDGSCDFDFINSVPHVPRVALSVSPNPTAGALRMAGADKLGKEIQLAVYTVGGALVLRRTMRADETLLQDLTPLAEGLYIMVVRGEKGYAVETILRR